MFSAPHHPLTQVVLTAVRRLSMKRNIFFSYLLVVVLSASAFSQASPSVERNLRKHVEYLASEKLQGRRTGEQGATDAAKYVAEQFAKYKLKTGVKTNGSKSTFLQPFPY